jgi:hypothetical protein
MFIIDTIYSSNIFHTWLIKSVDAEPENMGVQLCVCVYTARKKEIFKELACVFMGTVKSKSQGQANRPKVQTRANITFLSSKFIGQVASWELKHNFFISKPQFLFSRF